MKQTMRMKERREYESKEKENDETREKTAREHEEKTRRAKQRKGVFLAEMQHDFRMLRLLVRFVLQRTVNCCIVRSACVLPASESDQKSE